MALKIKISLSIKFTFFIIIFLFIILAVFTNFLLSQQKKMLIDQLIKRETTLIKTYAPQCEIALKEKDDLLLFSYLKSIMEDENTFSAFILDKDGKVIVHNKTEEWGQIYKDKISERALKAKNLLVQSFKRHGEKAYNISLPLLSDSHTFFIGFNISNIDRMIEQRRKNLYMASGIILFLMLSFSLILINRLVAKPLKQTKSMIEIASKGRLDEEIKVTRRDEIGEVQAAFKNLVNQFREINKYHEIEINTAKKSLNLFLENIGKLIKGGTILVDSNNNIIFLDDLAKEILRLPKEKFTGRHILEVIKEKELLDLLKDSRTQPNQILKTDTKEYKALVTTIQDEERLIGTAVFLEG